jgi:hypothetical protein
MKCDCGHNKGEHVFSNVTLNACLDISSAKDNKHSFIRSYDRTALYIIVVLVAPDFGAQHQNIMNNNFYVI